MVPADRPVALLDFPNHANCGDSAIWAGERAALDALGREVAYTCEVRSFSLRALDRIAPDATILLHGGGNVGDIYPRYQQFREAVIAACPHHRVVSLPQTVHFRDPAAEARAARSFASHPDLVVLARDTRSQETVARWDVPCRLAPDSALALTGLTRSRPPLVKELWLLREDPESPGYAVPPSPAREVRDWTDQPRIQRLIRRLPQATASRRGGSTAGFRSEQLLRLFDRLAAARVSTGVRILSRGERVVTNRLHAHILCCLAGIPHVLLDNSYGKNRCVYETWTSGLPGTTFADELPEIANERS